MVDLLEDLLLPFLSLLFVLYFPLLFHSFPFSFIQYSAKSYTAPPSSFCHLTSSNPASPYSNRCPNSNRSSLPSLLKLGSPRSLSSALALRLPALPRTSGTSVLPLTVLVFLACSYTVPIFWLQGSLFFSDFLFPLSLLLMGHLPLHESRPGLGSQRGLLPALLALSPLGSTSSLSGSSPEPPFLSLL